MHANTGKSGECHRTVKDAFNSPLLTHEFKIQHLHACVCVCLSSVHLKDWHSDMYLNSTHLYAQTCTQGFQWTGGPWVYCCMRCSQENRPLTLAEVMICLTRARKTTFSKVCDMQLKLFERY